jgi:hypothetical protein
MEDDEYNQVLDLMRNKLTKDLYTRQVDLLERLCRRCEEKGFNVSKLDTVRQLMEECGTNIVEEGREEFVKPLNYMIRVCRVPFLLESASAHIQNQHQIRELLSSIGTYILVPDTALTAIETLHSFWNQIKTRDDEGTMTFNQIQIDKSTVIQSVGAAIRKEAAAEQEETSPLLKFILDISRVHKTAVQTCQSGVLEGLIAVLNKTREFSQEIVDVLRLLTETTENDEKDGAILKLSTDLTFETLHKYLEQLVKEGYRRTDKVLRNEVLILLTTLASRSENHSRFLSNETLSILLACT